MGSLLLVIAVVTVLQLPVAALSFVVGSLIPLLVAVVAKAGLSSTVKTWINVALSAVAGALAPVIAAQGKLDVWQFITSIFIAATSSAAFHQGVWKPSGISGAVQRATAGFGIGSGPPTT